MKRMKRNEEVKLIKEVKEEKKIPKINVRSWFMIRKINKFEWEPREVYSKKKKMKIATIQEWDEFFKKY